MYGLGVLGGAVHEGMTDLVKLMSTLVDSNGKILVDGVMDTVKPVTPEEEALYESIEFNVDEFKEENKVNVLQHDKMSLLMARWRYPTLSLHGIEGAFSGKGAKTVIPAKCIGKFSMRLVPDQNPKEIEKLVVAHVEKEFAKVCHSIFLPKVFSFTFSSDSESNFHYCSIIVEFTK